VSEKVVKLVRGDVLDVAIRIGTKNADDLIAVKMSIRKALRLFEECKARDAFDLLREISR
jgi:hypothetical protein